MSAVALDALDTRVAAIAAVRQRGRRVRFTTYLIVAALVLWSMHAIVIADTDWGRILTGSLLDSLAKFLEIDVKLIPELWEPALETVLMATVATLAGLVMSIPVAWLGLPTSRRWASSPTTSAAS